MTGPEADEHICSIGKKGASAPHREVDDAEEVVQAWRDLHELPGDALPEGH